MFGTLRRFFGRTEVESTPEPVADWARRRGLRYRRARGDVGFVIEGELESKPWRLEWGQPQRAYIAGRELRLRMELGLPLEQQMLLLSRSLMDALEHQTYEQFVGDVQTQAGSDTPEEMRWLVMFPKLDLSASEGLGARFGAVASQPAIGVDWIGGPLARLLLDEASQGLLRDDPPLVLMTLRGRVYLRLQLAVAEPQAIAAAIALFETAVAQAVRVAGEVRDLSDQWNAEATTAWQTLQPGDEGAARRRR